MKDLRSAMRDFVVKQWADGGDPGPLVAARARGADQAVVELRAVRDGLDRILAFREALGIVPALGGDEAIVVGPGRDDFRHMMVTVECRRRGESCEVTSTFESWSPVDGLQPIEGEDLMMIEPPLLEALVRAVLGKDHGTGIGRAPLAAAWSLKAKGHASFVARDAVARLGASG